ncbi:MAG TPA: hypothetical protein VLH35_01380 [Candidatus Acidoferrales bacterium]|nr:hypothetical protein [Candidatus Acidoferrales bacterium]
MTLYFYVKTLDDPPVVGEAVCAANSIMGQHPGDEYTWILQSGRDEPGYWEIRGKYAKLKDLTEVAIVYRIGDTVVLAEVDDALVPNFADPLITKYGFDSVRWLSVSIVR